MKLKIYMQLTYLRDRFGFLSRPIDAIRYSGHFDEVFNEGGMQRSLAYRNNGPKTSTVLAIILGSLFGGMVALAVTAPKTVPCQQLPTNTNTYLQLPTVAPTATPSLTPTTTPTLPRKRGMASYYSRVGCVGCYWRDGHSGWNLYMNNGEVLKDEELTIALVPEMFRKHQNHFVEVRNMANGMSVRAKVTDSGGFGKLNRIADMTIATRDAIGCSNLCEVEIVEL